MVVIFGWGAGEAKDLGEIAPTTCPNCRNHVFLHHIRSEKRVSLYFVPLVSYGSNEYLACPICRHGIGIGPEHHQAISAVRAATALYRKGGLTNEAYAANVERFWAAIGVAPSGEQVLRPAPAASAVAAPERAAPNTGLSLAAQLEGLATLHADGVLTDEEFAAAKRRLLER